MEKAPSRRGGIVSPPFGSNHTAGTLIFQFLKQRTLLILQQKMCAYFLERMVRPLFDLFRVFAQLDGNGD